MKQEFSSLSTSRFKTIIPIRKIQTLALLKQEAPLPFPDVPHAVKCNSYRKRIQFIQPKLVYNKIEEQTQLTKKIKQTIRSNFKKSVYQFKTNQQKITQNQQSQILKITITYEGRDTIYEFNHRETSRLIAKNERNFTSKNLLKIVGVFDQNDTRPIFTFKIRSFYQMYLQNQLEWNYVHFYDHYPNSNNEITQQLISNEQHPPIKCSLQNQLFRLNETIQQYEYEIDEEYEQPLKIMDCSQKSNFTKKVLYSIITKLNDGAQNYFLSKFSFDEPSMEDESLHCPSRFIRQDNFKIRDQVQIAKRYYETYNILYGDFEDIHEILNFQDNITMLEFEENIKEQVKEQAQLIIKPKKLNFESIMKKSNKVESLLTNEISPRSDHSQISTIMRTPRETHLQPIKYENSKIKLRTSPPSYDENISNKQSTHHSKTTSQPDMITISTHRPQRTSLAINLSLRTSMTKNSLKTRTLVVEQIKRSHQQANELIPMLIQESKINELIELFNSNPNLRYDERLPNGNTFLMVAAQTGNVEICELILSKGAMVNLQNLQGDTALHKAFQYGHFGIADLLVSYGAEVLKNNKGKTPWQM